MRLTLHQWEYFVPVTRGMPANCSKDVGLVIDYIDELAMTNDTVNQKKLKEQFGFGDLNHFDDFA